MSDVVCVNVASTAIGSLFGVYVVLSVEDLSSGRREETTGFGWLTDIGCRPAARANLSGSRKGLIGFVLTDLVIGRFHGLDPFESMTEDTVVVVREAAVVSGTECSVVAAGLLTGGTMV